MADNAVKELIISCGCGERTVPIEGFINKHGLVDTNPNWQCPKCWNVVTFCAYEPPDGGKELNEEEHADRG